MENTPTPPVGLSTKVGLISAAIAAIVAGVAAVAQGDHTPETIAGIISAAFILYGVIRSRGEQAAAMLAAPPATYVLPAADPGPVKTGAFTPAELDPSSPPPAHPA